MSKWSGIPDNSPILSKRNDQEGQWTEPRYCLSKISPHLRKIAINSDVFIGTLLMSFP
jgi:hypothetical protein